VTDRPVAGASDGTQEYPGQRFGLPEEGARSVSSVGRRLGALLIDWLLCEAIALAAFHPQGGHAARGQAAPADLHELRWTFVFFAAEVFLLTATTGFTVGKRLFGVRVVRLDGRPVGFARSLLRLLLLFVVVPPLVFDKDLRGLHDRAAGTIVIRI
jgi:uncharacterized RDD family membrane protein YckC